jgi:uncharacterized membrane protein (Fun14 family)
MNEPITFLLKTVGLGILTGFVFGYLFKKVSKIVLFIAAIIVVLIFVFGHNELLDINWLSIKDQALEFFSKHFDNYSDRLRILLTNLPFIIGLVIGGLIGLKKA